MHDWKGAACYAGHPKWDVNLILVGNVAGFGTLTDMNDNALCKDIAEFFDSTVNDKHRARLRRHPCSVLHYQSPKPSHNFHLWAEPAEAQTPSGKHFTAAPAEPRQPVSTAAADMMPGDVYNQFSGQSALLVDPEQLIYTDGSVGTVQQGHNAHTDTAQADAGSQMRATCPERMPNAPQLTAGAGIYLPNKTLDQLGAPAGAATEITNEDGHAKGTMLYIDPCGQGATNTITRAESAAILQALDFGPHIATDSAACMYQLKNMMMKPMRMRHHKNKHMLQAILLKQHHHMRNCSGRLRPVPANWMRRTKIGPPYGWMISLEQPSNTCTQFTG